MSLARIALALLALILAIIGMGIYLLSLILNDHLSFRERELPYFIVLNSAVQDFPRYATRGDRAHFVYRMRDGEAPEHITMTYVSANSLENIVRSYTAYCVSEGYETGDEPFFQNTQLVCDSPGYRMEVGVRSMSEGGARVSVEFLR